jgi:hypothetical protein
VIAKSNVILDVKPWDDETNMKGEELVKCDIVKSPIKALVLICRPRERRPFD